MIDERQNKMGKNLKDEVEYYYDSHPTLEDLMGETSIHAELVRYFMLVLTRLFRGQRCALYSLRLHDSNHQLRLTGEEALIQKLRSLGVNPDEI